MYQKGELIASINSEKIETEIEAPADGTVLDIAVSEDEGVPPGTVICYIGKLNEKVEINESINVVEEKAPNLEPKKGPISRTICERSGEEKNQNFTCSEENCKV
ncbi:biotin/lipoyl-containing protein [Bacillus cereus]